MSIVDRVRYFIRHRFVRDGAVLQVGTAVGTFVQALSGVLVARILKPELFGQYSVAFSVASIVTIFLGAGVQDAVAPQTARAWATGDRSSFLQALGFFTKFTLANIIATVAVAFALPAITSRLYGSGIVGQYATVVVLASLISTTVFTLVQFMLQVTGRIKTLSLVTLADVVVRYGVTLTLLITGFGIWGAVAGHVIGAVVMFGAALIVYTYLAREYTQLPGLKHLLSLAGHTSWQPLLRPTFWVMVDRNLGMLYGALPVALMGIYASSPEVSYFKLAFGYLMLAMTALGPISTLLNVHFPTVQVTDHSRLRSTFIRVTLYSTFMTTGITAVVLALSPWIFKILYGPVYMSAVPYVFGFALFGALFGLGVGLGPMWRSVDRVRVSIIINAGTLFLGVPLGIWLITYWHIWGAVAMVTLWYTISHAVSFIYLLRVLPAGRQD